MLVGGNSKLDEDASRLGLPAELIGESESFKITDEIYPDNAQTVFVFDDIKTQWRVGQNGVVGLDYTVLPFVFRTRKVPVDKRAFIFDGLKIMENAAISEIQRR